MSFPSRDRAANNQESSQSFQRGLAVGGIKVIELIPADHCLEISLSPTSAKPFRTSW